MPSYRHNVTVVETQKDLAEKEKIIEKEEKFDLEREGGQFAGRLLQLCRFHGKRAVLFCSSIARCQNTQQIACKATNKHGARTEKKAGGQKKLDCATEERSRLTLRFEKADPTPREANPGKTTDQ